MGTYSFGEYLDTFGGMPEPGETYPDDPDTAREALEEEERAAAMDAAEFNDPREQDRLSAESDLREEYSRPEYDDNEREETT